MLFNNFKDITNLFIRLKNTENIIKTKRLMSIIQLRENFKVITKLEASSHNLPQRCILNRANLANVYRMHLPRYLPTIDIFETHEL